MVKGKRFSKIFPGWWIVLTSGFISFWAHGYVIFGLSALFKPLASELGLQRAVTSTAASIGSLEGALEAPLIGWISDRFGPRWIILLGVFLLGLGLVLMNFIGSLWAFLIVWGVIVSTGNNIASTGPPRVAISNWFVKKRGLALSIKEIFDGLGGILVLPLVALLIATQGWRMTCVIGGVVMWLVGLPLVWLFLKQHRPEYYGLLPDGAAQKEIVDTSQMIAKGISYAAEAEEVEFTLRQAMRTIAFWLLIIASACHGLASPVINIHCIPFLTDLGINPVKAAGMMALISLCSLPARLVGGVVADRLKKRGLCLLMAGAYFMMATGFGVFLLYQTTAMIYVWFFLWGFGNGVSQPLTSLVRARYFGRKAVGSIGGISGMLMAPARIAAPIYAGWVYDTTGSYITAFSVVAAVLAFGALLLSFITPPKPPAGVTDIRKIM